MNKYLEKIAEINLPSKAVTLLSRAKATAVANKGNSILGKTIEKINAIKDPYSRIAVAMGRY